MGNSDGDLLRAPTQAPYKKSSSRRSREPPSCPAAPALRGFPRLLIVTRSLLRRCLYNFFCSDLISAVSASIAFFNSPTADRSLWTSRSRSPVHPLKPEPLAANP